MNEKADSAALLDALDGITETMAKSAGQDLAVTLHPRPEHLGMHRNFSGDLFVAGGP
jgi:hypothetical protein